MILLNVKSFSLTSCLSVSNFSNSFDKSNDIPIIPIIFPSTKYGILYDLQSPIPPLSNIINHLPEHIYWLDKNNIFLGCNAEQARDFGLKDSSEVIGLHVSSFQTEENAQVIIKNNNHVMQTGKTIASEEDFLNNKGQKVYYLSKKSPLRDSMGKIIGTLGISFDITKEKQAEIIKRDFLSNMEHDLRTPFSGIGGIADLLNSCYADKYPELKEFFAIMTKSCTQWQEIHNRIFDALDL